MINKSPNLKIVFGLLTILFFLLSCSNTDNRSNYLRLSICDNWKFRLPSDTNWLYATVPGCIHSDLLKHNLIKDPYYRTNAHDVQWVDTVDWIYETTFDVPENFLEKDYCRLVFKCVDTYADIYLNDSLILSTDNYFLRWDKNVKHLLKAKQNKLHVQFYNAVGEGLKRLEISDHPLKHLPIDKPAIGALNEKKVNAFTRKPGYQFGWDWDEKFVSVGLREPIFIEAWDEAIIENVQIVQGNLTNKLADLTATAEVFASYSGKAVIEIIDTSTNIKLATRDINLVAGMNKVQIPFNIENPRLWWTNGLGEPHLYKLAFNLKTNGNILSTRLERIGLRTLKLVREPDSLGTTFYFELNGVPVFMKGANYIPNDNFLSRVTDEKYKKTIQYAIDANMNMLRIWGGGFYEKDIFYDLCDEKGILVWQDFMFGGGIYPADGHYLESVKEEVKQVAHRLRNHPCIALWCGNNETYEALDHWDWDKEFTAEEYKRIWADYYKLFNKEIPAVLQEQDTTRAYWPSSPLSDWDKVANWEGFAGDIHYWEIWFFNAPFEKVNIRHGRFNSEFGFQSFPEMKTIQQFSEKEDWDINSKVMAHRQKSYVGNQQIKSYMEMYYKYPSSFEKFVYMSQVLQAFGVKKAIEIQRKNMPVCMGSLYWQFNDCWPAISWSSLDYYLRWKALHYFVREANKPVIVIPEVSEGKVDIYIVSDKLKTVNATLDLTLMNFAGKKLWKKQKNIKISANSSNIYFSVPESDLITQYNKKTTLLLAEIKSENGTSIDSDILYFDLAKNLDLPEVKIDINIEPDGENYKLTLTSEKLCRNVYLSLKNGQGFFTDNYFDIIPGTAKEITIKDHDLPPLNKDNINIMTLQEGMKLPENYLKYCITFL